MGYHLSDRGAARGIFIESEMIVCRVNSSFPFPQTLPRQQTRVPQVSGKTWSMDRAHESDDVSRKEQVGSQTVRIIGETKVLLENRRSNFLIVVRLVLENPRRKRNSNGLSGHCCHLCTMSTERAWLARIVLRSRTANPQNYYETIHIAEIY